jgi:ComF family protein
MNETYKKFYGRLPIEHGSSIVYYHKAGVVQQLIHHLKYKGNEAIGELFGDLYRDEVLKIHKKLKFDAIIPVPLHPKKLRERGYNQVDLFGKSIAKTIDVPFNANLLRRNLYSKTQTKKNLWSRTEINNTLFDVEFSENEYGMHFLLVDDVITSGATLEACGKALLKIPNVTLSIITMAYAHS